MGNLRVVPTVRRNPSIKYTGDWHDFAKAYGVQVPTDEDAPGFNAKVMELQQKMVRNKNTISPEIYEWVDKLAAEAFKVGDFDVLAITRNMQLQLKTNGPRGVESVARNIKRLWV